MPPSASHKVCKNHDSVTHLQCRPEQIAERVVLCGDPARVDRIASQLEQCEVLGQNREFRLINGRYQGLPITVCSTGIGGASAVIALEELVQAGARSLIRVGSAGALQHDIGLGDLIVVEGAVRNEGASQAYLPPEYPPAPISGCKRPCSTMRPLAASLIGTGWYAPTTASIEMMSRRCAATGMPVAYWALTWRPPPY